MEKSTLKIEYIKTSELVLLEKNPRKISKEKIKELKKSIKSVPNYFQARPILVNNASGELVVYAGNQRLKASLELNMETVPCIIETLSQEEQDERTIRDNTNAGEWDFEELATWDEEKIVDWGVDLGFDNVDEIGDIDLPDGEKSPFQQMTFTLSNEQHEKVKEAMKIANEKGGASDPTNENSNANCLHFICLKFIDEQS